MAWEVLKCILKVYLCTNKIQRWSNFSHAHILIRQSSSLINFVRSTITIILSPTLVGGQNNYA
jgi:hypothetical protein